MSDRVKMLAEVRNLVEEKDTVSISTLRDRRDAVGEKLKSLGSTIRDMIGFSEDWFADMKTYKRKQYDKKMVQFTAAFDKIEKTVKDVEDAIAAASKLT